MHGDTQEEPFHRQRSSRIAGSIPAPGIYKTMNKYQKTIKGVELDVYDICAIYEVTCSARSHAIKKLLMAGQRGHKDEKQDLLEAIQAIQRSIELLGS